MDLTKEAAEGYDWQSLALDQMDVKPSAATVITASPYLNTSPSAMAWHLGRHLATPGLGTNGNPRSTRPTPGDDHPVVKVASGKGDSFHVSGYKHTSLGSYRWQSDNTFREIIRK